MSRAKIVAALGPATSSISTLEELIDSGRWLKEGI
jgi:pyruvate kinase